MNTPSAFDLLDEGLKRQLWRMKWKELKPLQTESIRHILTTEQHAILSAGTAAGKTEAAFLPILSKIASEPEGSVRAIYVGPLKALINDQFTRLEELCGYLDLKVHRWHGDVSAAAKQKLVANPCGVLLITPESLESLFVNRANSLSKLFNGLRFVVIDELHSFLDGERGLHLRSLLHRLNRITEKPPRLIGLSATLGDPKIASDYLAPGTPENVKLILGDSSEPELKLKLHAYLDTREKDEIDGDETDTPPAHTNEMAADIVKHCKGSTNLIFANARNDVELFSDLANRIARQQNLPDEFLVHHGSLSAEIRVDAETRMKQTSKSGRPATTFCTSTMEMGIDIGSVQMVGQIGAPGSVAGLKQRVGRSGRREGAARILRIYLQCRSVTERSNLFDRLHLKLVQSIAVTELLLEKWVEPAEVSRLDLSTLTQQIISVIAQFGAASAESVFNQLCNHGAFPDIDTKLFAKLLRHLGAVDIIEQSPEGELILGLVGELVRKDKSFYAVFMSSDSYTVMHDSQKLGSVDAAIDPGQHLILAGRRWMVIDLDQEQKLILVKPARGFRATPFGGGGGRLHAQVVEMMRQILLSNDNYSYLNNTAARLLSEARLVATAAKIMKRGLVELSGSQTAIMTWADSRTTNTIIAMLNLIGCEATSEDVGIILAKPFEVAKNLIERIVEMSVSEDDLAAHIPARNLRKYDHLLDDNLRWISNNPILVDVSSAKHLLATIFQDS